MLRSALTRLNAVVDEAILRLGGGGFPPIAPALAIDPSGSSPVGAASSQGYSLEQLVSDMRTLWGVPKYRTSKPKKQTRKFAYTRVYTPFGEVAACDKCGSVHEAGVICGVCYEKVRELTNAIKMKMMEYNPYKGEMPDKEVKVRFKNDEEEGVKNGMRVVELERERPSWFRPQLLRK